MALAKSGRRKRINAKHPGYKVTEVYAHLIPGGSARGGKARKSTLPLTRVFDGKRYTLDADSRRGGKAKNVAEKMVKGIRKEGKFARLVGRETLQYHPRKKVKLYFIYSRS